MIVASMETKGVGWSVYDMELRRRVAGPYKGRDARNFCLKIDLDLRRVPSGDQKQIDEVIAKHEAKRKEYAAQVEASVRAGRGKKRGRPRKTTTGV